MEQERRKHPRLSALNVLGSLLQRSVVEIVDICAAGVSVESPKRLAPGRSYRLRLLNEGQPLDLHGRVVWCRVHSHRRPKTGTTFYRAGISFDGALTSAGAFLQRLIAENATFRLDMRYFCRFSFENSFSADVESQHEFRVRGLSTAGMLIETDFMLQPEEVFEGRIRLNQNLLSLGGRVVHARQALGEGNILLSHVGIEFTHIAGDARQVLQSFLDSRTETEI